MVSIVQTLVAGASEYERKSQRIDRAGLSGKHEVTLVDADEVRTSSASVVHIYGPFPLPATVVSNSSVPFIANAPVASSRFSLRKPRQPAFIVSPLGPPYELLPEAVEEKWFEPVEDRQSCLSERKEDGQAGLPVLHRQAAYQEENP